METLAALAVAIIILAGCSDKPGHPDDNPLPPITASSEIPDLIPDDGSNLPGTKDYQYCGAHGHLTWFHPENSPPGLGLWTCQ